MEETRIEKLTKEEYAAIDLVPPYSPGDGIPLERAIENAKKRTHAWIAAAEVIEKSA